MKEKPNLFGSDIGRPNIIGKSKIIRSLLSLIEKIAGSDKTTVLIEGESGTGKELVAKAIHWFSKRAPHPFVAINCAALPESLLESELMGYAGGAFTDAKKDKKGLLEVADQGTLFLDEIGAIGLNMQAKLLRILEEKTFRPLGSTKSIKIDVRFFSATNTNLKKRIAERRFREDLYYRLNTIPVYLPPLRERKEDILLLSDYFLKEYNQKFKKKVRSVSIPAKKFLLNYHWPGNVRQLRNVIEMATLLTEDKQILLKHLSPEIISKEKKGMKSFFFLPAQGISLFEVEKNFISQALKITKGNQTKAAELLGLKRDALRRRLKKYKLGP